MTIEYEKLFIGYLTYDKNNINVEEMVEVFKDAFRNAVVSIPNRCFTIDQSNIDYLKLNVLNFTIKNIIYQHIAKLGLTVSQIEAKGICWFKLINNRTKKIISLDDIFKFNLEDITLILNFSVVEFSGQVCQFISYNQAVREINMGKLIAENNGITLNSHDIKGLYLFNSKQLNPNDLLRRIIYGVKDYYNGVYNYLNIDDHDVLFKKYGNFGRNNRFKNLEVSAFDKLRKSDMAATILLRIRNENGDVITVSLDDKSKYNISGAFLEFKVFNVIKNGISYSYPLASKQEIPLNTILPKKEIKENGHQEGLVAKFAYTNNNKDVDSIFSKIKEYLETSNEPTTSDVCAIWNTVFEMPVKKSDTYYYRCEMKYKDKNGNDKYFPKKLKEGILTIHLFTNGYMPFDKNECSVDIDIDKCRKQYIKSIKVNTDQYWSTEQKEFNKMPTDKYWSIKAININAPISSIINAFTDNFVDKDVSIEQINKFMSSYKSTEFGNIDLNISLFDFNDNHTKDYISCTLTFSIRVNNKFVYETKLFPQGEVKHNYRIEGSAIITCTSCLTSATELIMEMLGNNLAESDIKKFLDSHLLFKPKKEGFNDIQIKIQELNDSCFEMTIFRDQQAIFYSKFYN